MMTLLLGKIIFYKLRAASDVFKPVRPLNYDNYQTELAILIRKCILMIFHI
jgi:hypothetical protein